MVTRSFAFYLYGGLIICNFLIFTQFFFKMDLKPQIYIRMLMIVLSAGIIIMIVIYMLKQASK